MLREQNRGVAGVGRGTLIFFPKVDNFHMLSFLLSDPRSTIAICADGDWKRDFHEFEMCSTTYEVEGPNIWNI